jgi:1,4-dihydroxy-2-naphthoate octaprenyltransferase
VQCYIPLAQVLQIALFQIAGWVLREYFSSVDGARILSWEKNKREKRIFFQAAILILTLGAILTYLLSGLGVLSFTASVLLGSGFIATMVYAVPPFQVSEKGLGEIVQAIFAATLAPMLGVALQTGEIHRYAALFSLPFSFLVLARGLVLVLPDFAKEMQTGFKSMMGKLGWRNGMNLHNLFILTAFVMIGLLPWFGLAWGLVWPVLLCLPLGLLQIWQIIQISSGGQPKWRSLKFIANVLPLTAVYLLMLGFWTR